ncbi:MAG: flagellin [Clostridia bacterium]|nr:MAG: flagellin [Clostridia bacterium]
MRINQNIAALNAYRNLSITNNAMNKSLERLSSGLRINRASDDAAGLAISEKMRGQVKGLNQATRNAQDGVSLIQTAEGALNETHSILQRMRELAVQSANDTNTNEDRYQIQKEMDQLASELSRISNTTEFNTKNLLAGGLTEQLFQIGANQGQNIQLDINAMDAYTLGVAGTLYSETNIGAASGTAAIKVTGYKEYTIVLQKATATTDLTTATISSNTITVKLAGTYNSTTTAISATLNDVVAALNNGAETAGLVTAELESGATGTANVVTESETLQGTPSYAATTGANGVVTQDAFVAAGITVITQADANAAVTTIDNAIRQVSSERSKLGAVQNRLEHTIANLGVAKENLTAAESRIRDLDMAEEMMSFTRNQILAQAGTAMLEAPAA